MAKIAILVNHSFPHVGGSEQVVLQVSERLVKNFNHEVTVVSGNTMDTMLHNGVEYRPIQSVFQGDNPVGLLNIKPDHIFVYSDSFKHFRNMVYLGSKIDCNKSIALLGMYTMATQPSLRSQFVKAVDTGEWTPIVHSKTGVEYQHAVHAGMTPTIIPNGVDTNEFTKKPEYFRAKYNIKTKYVLLCVANFFPGKGQEYLIHILKRISAIRNDFTAVFIANHSNTKVVNDNMVKFARLIETCGCAYRLLWDTPREDVVQAYFESDLFTFTSQKEVSPLVLLECMAARLPFITMDVGNASELSGGMIIKWSNFDPRGFGEYNNETFDYFASQVTELLDNPDGRRYLGTEGRTHIDEKYNWDSIVKQYNQVFAKR